MIKRNGNALYRGLKGPEIKRLVANRKRKVLIMRAAGMSYREIANQIGSISANRVYQIVHNIL